MTETTDRILEDYIQIIGDTDSIKLNGKVSDVIGFVIVSVGPNVSLGEMCLIIDKSGKEICKSEVVGFKDGKVLSIALGNIHNIAPSCQIVSTGRSFAIGVGENLLGRVIDGFGNPIDGKGDIEYDSIRNAFREPPNPLSRKRIEKPLQTGVRAIDGLLTVGKGQRIGSFSGSGGGKSVMLGMIARNTDADVSIIVLVGERGREVKEFIEKDLGKEGLKKSIRI